MASQFSFIKLLADNFFIGLSLLVTITQVHGKTEIYSDPDAYKQLNTLLPAGCHHSGKFDQSLTLVAISEPIKSSGDFIFSCSNGLVWSTRVPTRTSLIYPSNSKPVMIDSQGIEQQIDSRVQREIGKLLNNLIGGDLNYLASNFNISRSGNIYSLTPMKKRLRKYISRINLNLTANGTKIIMVQPNQNIEIVIYSLEILETLYSEQCKNTFSSIQEACERLLK